MQKTELPPGNDKIHGTLSTAENFVPKKKIFNLKFFFLNLQNFRGREAALRK